MHWLLNIFLLYILSISCNNNLVETFDLRSIKNDISKFGVSCPNDYCQFSQVDSLEFQACHCGMHCAQLGTCCFDSPYTDVPQPKSKPTCQYVYTKGLYFIVHKCPFIDSAWASECNDELNGDDDLQKLVPVTSLVTNITYKNYYCFRCYEAGDEFSYWTLKIDLSSVPFRVSEGGTKELSKHLSYIYNKKENKVMASLCGGIVHFIVDAALEIPSEIKNLTHVCDVGVISDCSEEWSDEEMRNECQSYMAIKEVERVGMPPIKYKNIHCALCNYENLNSISCMKTFSSGFGNGAGGYGGYSTGHGGYSSGHGGYNGVSVGFGGGSGGYGGAAAAPGSSAGGGGRDFSLKTLFNINPTKFANNKQTENNQKCSNDQQGCSDNKKKCPDGEQLNPYSGHCKKLTCLMPGFKVKNYKCVKD